MTRSASIKGAKFSAVDIFSGCGGLTLGLIQAGFSVRAAVEMDPLAADTYQLNHKFVPVLRKDVREVSGSLLLTQAGIEPGELDLLAGCPPCQGFSRIRHRNHNTRMLDDRNALIDEIARLVKELRPKVVMLENVPALKNYHRFRSFLRVLKAENYKFSYEIVDSADFGVPQRRLRLVLLASRLGKIEHISCPESRLTVRTAIGMLAPAGRSNDPLHDTGEVRSERIKRLIAAVPKDGGSRTDLRKSYELACHAKTDGFFDVYGRMRWDDVAPTITGGCINPSKGRFIHPSEDRAITLREAALLQTFPKRYQFSLTKGKYAAAEMIGNP